MHWAQIHFSRKPHQTTFEMPKWDWIQNQNPNLHNRNLYDRPLSV